MLVLTRQTNQSVMIGHDIEVVVVGMQNGKVRLGFIAPSQTKIHRKEVYQELNELPVQAHGQPPSVCHPVKPNPLNAVDDIR